MKVGLEIKADTEAAKRGVKPGSNNPPKAAQAGVGATTRAEIEQAATARCNLKPGSYRK